MTCGSQFSPSSTWLLLSCKTWFWEYHCLSLLLTLGHSKVPWKQSSLAQPSPWSLAPFSLWQGLRTWDLFSLQCNSVVGYFPSMWDTLSWISRGRKREDRKEGRKWRNGGKEGGIARKKKGEGLFFFFCNGWNTNHSHPWMSSWGLLGTCPAFFSYCWATFSLDWVSFL